MLDQCLNNIQAISIRRSDDDVPQWFASIDKGCTIRYLGGGGARVFVACKFFFYRSEITIFFWAINVRQCFVEEMKYLFFCRMLSLLCTSTFGGLSGQHIFHQFRQQTFFFCPHFNKLFFPDLRGDKYLFHFFLPPPPRYQMVRP